MMHGRALTALGGDARLCLGRKSRKNLLCATLSPLTRGLALQGGEFRLVSLLGVLGIVELEGVMSNPARRAPAAEKKKD